MDRIGLPLPWGIVPAERLWIPVTGADPAAGAEASVTVPGGEVWVVRSLVVTLVTSAVVGNRFVRLQADDGQLVYWSSRDMAGQAAGTTRLYSYYVGAGVVEDTGAASQNVGSFLDAPMLPGHRVRTVTTSIDPGDNYGAPVLYVAAYEIRGLERGARRYLEALAEAGLG